METNKKILKGQEIMENKDALNYLYDWERTEEYKNLNIETKDALSMARIALKKSIPKKLANLYGYEKHCPCCNEFIDNVDVRYCFNCGQRVIG